MGYDYYCTSCASKQNAQTVLYDMQELIAGSVKLKILKFRMTEQELRAFIQSGTPMQNGEYRCVLTLPMLLGYMSNEHNLDLPSLTELTGDQIREFVEYYDQNNLYASQPEDMEEDVFEAIDAQPAETPQAKQKAEEPVEKVWPKAIEDLKRQDKTTDSVEFAESRVRDELRLVSQLMASGDAYPFFLSLETEEDDKGGSVVTGVTMRDTKESRTRYNRICPKCGARMFYYAGTAEHKSVVFIGDQSAGKTSSILAMTHYARSHLQKDLGSEIWRGTSTIRDVSMIRLLEPAPTLSKELTHYNQGIAPKKTKVMERENAYSATFLITSQAGGKEIRKILTLMDLPGELCEWGGNLREDDIKNKFPVALACDTFVACFDTKVVKTAQNNGQGNMMLNPKTGEMELRLPNDVVIDTCSWADRFQKMLIRNTDKENYVPTMLLFTKCEELENNGKKDGQSDSKTEKEQHGDQARKKKKIVATNPVDAVYMFQEEREAIRTIGLYDFAQEQFGRTGGLSSAYYAVLRGSPFGYPAPAENEIAENPEREKDVKLPVPKNVDKLMRWILMVSGCIPTAGKYTPTLGGSDYYSLENYVISRPQFRNQNPQYPGNRPDEALARCSLFSNPGCHDRAFLSSYGNRARTQWLKLTTKRDTNDQKE